MKTVLEILQLATGHFEGAGLIAPRRLAEEVLAHALHTDRLALYLQFGKPLSEPELVRCREIVARCTKGEPIAQVAGCIEFFGLDVDVTCDVLVPRPETELLVEQVVREINPKEKVLWDIGCGSGCIGLAIKKYHPELRVVLSDRCPRALAVAEQNAKKNKIEVEFRCGDLLAPFAGEQADYVVSNPPYISEADWEGLAVSVKDFEPRGALVGGITGLEVYQRLSTELFPHLCAQAKVWFEIGAGQGAPLVKLFSQPPWARARFDPDWAGHDRFFTVELEPLFALS